MLIGAELFWRIICAGQIRQSNNVPILQKTHFVWIISGVAANAKPIPSVSQFHLTAIDDLNSMLNWFWEIEHNITQQFSIEEQICEKLFLQGIRRNDKGRFIVALPIKYDNSSKISREIALQRFKALERHLIARPDIYE